MKLFDCSFKLNSYGYEVSNLPLLPTAPFPTICFWLLSSFSSTCPLWQLYWFCLFFYLWLKKKKFYFSVFPLIYSSATYFIPPGKMTNLYQVFFPKSCLLCCFPGCWLLETSARMHYVKHLMFTVTFQDWIHYSRYGDKNSMKSLQFYKSYGESIPCTVIRGKK